MCARVAQYFRCRSCSWLARSLLALGSRQAVAVQIDLSVMPDGKHPKIEKYILRQAFDTPDDPYLPDSVLYRQKEAFSDGVGYSWVDGLKEYAESVHTNVPPPALPLHLCGPPPPPPPHWRVDAWMEHSCSLCRRSTYCVPSVVSSHEVSGFSTACSIYRHKPIKLQNAHPTMGASM